jgi:hypothetical protein
VVVTNAFPRRSLLLGVLWLPLATLVFYLCFAIGLGGIDYIHTATFVAVAVVCISGCLQELAALSGATRSFVANAMTRTPGNIAIFAAAVVSTLCLAALFLVAATAAWRNE